MSVVYDYTVSVDFSGVIPNLSQLEEEIEESVLITTSLADEALVRDDDDVMIYFQAALSVSEQNALDALVAAHVPVFSDEVSTTVNEFFFGESLSVSTVSHNAFYQKINLAIPATLNGGTYKVSYSYAWNSNTTSEDFLAKIEYDGYVKFVHRQKVKDSNSSFKSTGSNQRHRVGGFFLIEDPGGIARSIKLFYGAEKSGKAVSIWEATLTMERVGETGIGAQGITWQTEETPVLSGSGGDDD